MEAKIMGIPVNAKVDPAQVKRVTDLLTAILTGVVQGAGGSREDPIHIVFDDHALVGAIEKVAEALTLLTQPPPQEFHFEGGGFMRTYAQDRPADTVAFKKGMAVDSEGGAVDPQPDISYSFSSDDESIASVADNGDGTVTVSYGTFRKEDDGSFAMAEIRAESNEITLPNGSVIKDVVTEQIQLVPGEAAGFIGSGFGLPEA